jgi:hypothetical protein
MSRSYHKLIFAIAICLMLSGCGAGGGSEQQSPADFAPDEGTGSDQQPTPDPAPDDGAGDSGLCEECAASTITLMWDPSPEPEGVIGYYVYSGESEAGSTQLITDLSIANPDFDASSPQVQYSALLDLGLESGERSCFRVKAYNNYGVSEYSQAACTDV